MTDEEITDEEAWAITNAYYESMDHITIGRLRLKHYKEYMVGDLKKGNYHWFVAIYRAGAAKGKNEFTPPS